MVSDEIVKPGDHRGAARGDDALGVGRFAGLEHGQRDNRRHEEVRRQRAPGFARAAADVAEHAGDRASSRNARDEPVAQLARQRLGFRSEARDVHGDLVLEIDEPVLAHLEPDRMRLAVERVVDFLAAE